MTMNTTSRNRLLAGLLVVSLLAGVALTGAVGAQSTDNATTTGNGTGTTNGTIMTSATNNASLTADSTSAGAVTNHTLDATIGETVAGNFTEVSINYTAANASTGPAIEDVEDQNITVGNENLAGTDNVSVSAPEFQLVNYSFMLNQSLQPEAGDPLHLRYPVQNPPEAGNYTVTIVLTSGDNATVSYDTNITVSANETSAGGTSGTSMATETTVSAGGTDKTSGVAAQSTSGGATAQETTGASPGGEATTTGSGPGFTALAGLAGFFAVALFALRIN
jgi:PGF-CTERM protein